MSKRSTAPLLLLLLVGAVMVAFYAVIHLRLERGDAYPPGSSFRADPLGGKALFESLESISGIEVQRNFERLSDVEFGDDTVIIMAAAGRYDLLELESDAVRPLRDSIAQGARLVVAMKYRKSYDSWDEEEGFVDSEVDEEEEAGESEELEESDESIDSEDESDPLPGLDIYYSLSDDAVGPGLAELDPAFIIEESSLPSALTWQKANYWWELPARWETVYTLEEEVVVAQRPFGKGSIVIMTDSYLLSNEGLLKDRETAFLSWLIDDKSVVVFDETHFGVVEPQGITLLMKSYKLGPLALALAFLTGLFVWKHLSTLVPPRDELEEELVVRLDRAGQDAQTEFIRRRLSPDTLLTQCVSLWARSSGHHDAASVKRLAKAQQIAERSGIKSVRTRDLVTAYQEITKTLN